MRSNVGVKDPIPMDHKMARLWSGS